jgi:hypothetical protein
MKMKIKYFRTFHLPWSLGNTSDDKVLASTEHFVGKEVIVTEKMDGENTTFMRDCYYARSLDSASHESQSFARKFWSNIAYLIPKDFRIVLENCYAEHSIKYDSLDSYLYGLSVWDKNNGLSWNDTLEYFDLLGITPAPILYSGIWDEKLIKNIALDLDFTRQEGYVVRLASSFKHEDSNVSIAKFVRKNHVNTSTHWKNKIVNPNKLKARVDN